MSSSRCVQRPLPRYHLCLKVVWDETGNLHPLVTSAPRRHHVTSASTRHYPMSPPPHLLASLPRQRVLCHIITRVSCHVTLPYPVPANDVMLNHPTKAPNSQIFIKTCQLTILTHFYWSSLESCACCFTLPCLQSSNSTNRAAAICNFTFISRYYTSSTTLGD